MLFVIWMPGLRAADDEGPEEAFGGAEVLAIVRGAEKVEAYRIESDAATYRYTSEYKIVSKPVALDEKDARELVATMTDPNLYEWNSAKACLPQPGILFKFHRGGEVVDMPICLECAIFMVDYKGKPVGGEDCDAALGKLLDLAVRLFPEDAGFEEVKASREAEVVRQQKQAERQKVIVTLVSPADGAKLSVAENLNDTVIMESASDGSIWLWEEGKGVHKPDPGDENLQSMIRILVKQHHDMVKSDREFEEKLRKQEVEKPKLAETLASPVDGAKLTWLIDADSIDILQSQSDGSIWLYEEGKGVYKPDPNDRKQKRMILSGLKRHREREKERQAEAAAK